jgi:hypothetical protein
MELHMKAICDGQRSKEDVVEQSLEQYRAVYIRTKDQMNVIIAVSTNAKTERIILMKSRLYKSTLLLHINALRKHLDRMLIKAL